MCGKLSSFLINFLNLNSFGMQLIDWSVALGTNKKKYINKQIHNCTRTHNPCTFCKCVADLVRIDYDHSEINSNTDRQLGGDLNGPCQPCDADANDGEDSPLQSKRSSRF